MSQVEKPSYKLHSFSSNIQVRTYPPIIILRVQLYGHRIQALREGFKILANYIFSHNIRMTAPVEQILINDSFNNASSKNELKDGKPKWQISFFMPSKYKLQDLPTPRNDFVRLETVTERKYIVLKYSGKNNNENVYQHEDELMKYIKQKKLVMKGDGEIKYAFYNPPWTLPILRRNEIMVEMEYTDEKENEKNDNNKHLVWKSNEETIVMNRR